MKILLIVAGLCMASQSFAQSDSVRNNIPEGKDPVGAMWRSAILPGLGQWYNESYWKTPVVAGSFAGLGLIMNWYHNRYIDYKYQTITAQRLEVSGQTPQISSSILKQYREFYRDNRDLYMFYMILAYFLNIVDAYVDAHLFGFDVDGPLGQPSAILPESGTSNSPNIRLTLRIPIL